MKNNIRGRPKGTKKQKSVILDYRTWILEYDGAAWPSINYILRKKGTRYLAYCGTLESALKMIYVEMLIDYVNRKNDYGAKFNDLAKAIKTTKNDLARLLDITPILKNEIKTEKKQND